MNTTTKELDVVQYNAAAIKVNRFSLPPRSICFRTHWHDRMEFLRIHSGTLTVEYGTHTVVALPNDVVIIPPKMMHKGFTTDQDVEYDVLMFDVRSFYNETDVCQNLLSSLFDGRAKIKPVTDDEETCRLFDTVYGCNEDDSLSLVSHVYRLLDVLFKNNLLSLQNANPDNVIQKSMLYIEEHFAEDITLRSISEQFGYSPAHFSRKFKQITGLAPSTYLMIFRLEKAYTHIKYGTANISEVAAACGFSDANYFTRCFKKHFGFPPTYYKK